MMASRPSPEAAKQHQTITHSPPFLMVGMSVCFSPNITFLIEAKKFYLFDFCPENIVPEVLWIRYVLFGELQTAAMFFLESSGFLLAILP
ncbi:hypothetical protein FKM82_027086 [Ascaphus truei]